MATEQEEQVETVGYDDEKTGKGVGIGKHSNGGTVLFFTRPLEEDEQCWWRWWRKPKTVVTKVVDGKTLETTLIVSPIATELLYTALGDYLKKR